MSPTARSQRLRLALAVLLGSASLVGFATWASSVPTTPADFALSGSQPGDVPGGVIQSSGECAACHGNYDPQNEPWSTWKGSLMGLAGRDPLFFAQLTTANQDAPNVGTFCLRCHVPVAWVSGHATADPWGNNLDEADRDGVTCHFCHSMVDPIYQPGQSPPEDVAILGALAAVPDYYGNSMFVLDPQGRRRGPYLDNDAPHTTIASPFFRSASMCGTCHDVGNVAVSRQPNGTYRYNLLDAPVPDEDLATQFPLERTYTEWKLSSFAATGVDLGGRFGGARGPVVSTCQDCHMPATTAQGCFFGRVRTDLAIHEFAGAAVPSLDLILEELSNDPTPPVDPALVSAGRARALSMLQRAATVIATEVDGELSVRVVNETGHKLPTGHIEGRRVWVNVRFLDSGDEILSEYGAYDLTEATLDEVDTTIFEMKVGLSPDAATATGLPAGVTHHMALADTIELDSRIPPRGFTNATFEAGGAPVVGTTYADGQYWHLRLYTIPSGAVRAEVTLNYQSLPRPYIEALRDGNVTDSRGDELHALWTATGRGAPIPMVSRVVELQGALFADGFESGSTGAWSSTTPAP